MYLAQLISEGWKFLYTDIVPHNVDGFTSCTSKTVWFNTFEILWHEIEHAVYDCPNWVDGMGVVIDFI